MLRSATFSFTNHLGTLIAIDQQTKNFFEWLGLGFVMFNGFFKNSLTPSTLGGHNFLNFNMFLIIFSALDTPIDKFMFCFDTENNRAFPLDPACLEHFNDHSWAVLHLKWPLYVQLWSFISTSSQVQMLNFFFHQPHMPTFHSIVEVLGSLNYNGKIKSNTQKNIKFWKLHVFHNLHFPRWGFIISHPNYTFPVPKDSNWNPYKFNKSIFF